MPHFKHQVLVLVCEQLRGQLGFLLVVPDRVVCIVEDIRIAGDGALCSRVGDIRIGVVVFTPRRVKWKHVYDLINQ